MKSTRSELLSILAGALIVSRLARIFRKKLEAKPTGTTTANVNASSASIEHSADQRPAQNQPADNDDAFRLNVLLQPAKLITWLGAATGGLTIILVVIGFIALNGHDEMLGVPRKIEDKSEYIAVGALFFIRSILFILASFLDNPNCWILVTILIVALILSYLFKRYFPRQVWPYSISAIGVIGAEFYVFWRISDPTRYRNVLFNLGDLLNKNAAGTNTRILSWIVSDSRAALESEYGFLALLFISLAFLLKRLESRYQRRLTDTPVSPEKMWRWLRIPAFALVLIIMFSLLRCYGVLTIQSEYPLITPVSAKSEQGFCFPLLLIRDDEKFVVLYDPRGHKLITMKRDLIDQFVISGSKSVFSTKFPQCE